MNVLGQIVMWGGFLSGSLATVFRLEVVDDKWSTINWIWYGLSIAVGVAGVALIRISKWSLVGKSEKSQADLAQIKTSLHHLIATVGSFNASIATMTPKQMVVFIDEQLSEDLRTFADGRDSITAEHNLEVFAEVMTQFAAGERAINRAWCAAADRYVDEAANCVMRALAFFQEAQNALDDAATTAGD
jgi:hypothetical protein